MTGFDIGVVCSTGVGPDRGGRGRNEDNYLICQDGRVAWLDGEAEKTEQIDGRGVLLVVCDGMGGHEHGDLASRVAVRVMAKLYASGGPRDPERALRRYVRDAHRKLHERARDAAGKVRMGTTLTACWILDHELSWIQVGDSRLYLFRDGVLTLLTPEHTLGEFRKRDGRTMGDDREQLAQNFIYGSRGIGHDGDLRLEAGADSGRLTLRPHDRILLCTDGLWGSVDDVSIGQVLRHTPDPQPAAVAAMERAIARGSTDNITAVVARVRG